MDNKNEIYRGGAMSRDDIIGLLKSKLANFGDDEETNRQIAYEMAGMMSLDSVRELDETDPIVDCMLLAGEMELPVEHRRPESSWSKLIEKISSLV